MYDVLKRFPGGKFPTDNYRRLFMYRRHILDCKKKWSSARGLIHYTQYVKAYLEAKKQHLRDTRLHSKSNEQQ